MNTIEKHLLKAPAGFTDWHPGEAVELNRMLDSIKGAYEMAGYMPLHTPIIERPEILFAKAEGEIRNQVYGLRLMNPAENSPTDEKNLALRFDHTVALARYASAYQGELRFPFRRYAIGPVVRGERPKDGRYREFIQADIDVIGYEKLSFDHDAEMILMISNIFDQLDFGAFTIRINNRKLLTGFLDAIGCENETAVRKARDVIDNLEKVGRDETVRQLSELNINEEKALEALEFLTRSYSVDEALQLVHNKRLEGRFAVGVAELEQVIAAVRAFGVPEGRYCVDLSVARGLDYYTSTVFEARLDEHPRLGSIAGGGRYDNLADYFSTKHLPGVGVSIGITRLLQRLIKLGLVKATGNTITKVLAASRDLTAEKELHFKRAQLLRGAGIATEIYLERRDLGAQLNFAARRGIGLVIFTDQGENTDAGQKVIVRNIAIGEQVTVPEEALLETVQGML